MAEVEPAGEAGAAGVLGSGLRTAEYVDGSHCSGVGVAGGPVGPVELSGRVLEAQHGVGDSASSGDGPDFDDAGGGEALVTARGSKRAKAETPGEEILPRAEVGRNRAVLDTWLETVEQTPRVRVLAELARSLADEMDTIAWTPPVARELRVTLGELADLIAGESTDDGETSLRLVMSSPVRDSA